MLSFAIFRTAYGEAAMTHQPFFVPAVLFFAAAIPLILGLIPPNRVYGIRTSKTLSDESVWYDANRYGGWAIVLSSTAYLAVAKAVPTSGPHDPDFSLWLLHLSAFALPLILGILQTVRYTRNL